MPTYPRTPTLSTNEVFREDDTTRFLTDDLAALETGKAPVNHTHEGYAAASHTHTGFAAEDHTHTGYAAANHEHTGYASSEHTHDNYLPKAGGTIEGDTNIDGILRICGQQAFFYNESANSQIIGTNNATRGTTICCGPNGLVTINGTAVRPPHVLPKATGTYYCGDSNFRWKGIYSVEAVNVSSDERLKRDIDRLDCDDAREDFMNFINNLPVALYNYKTDPEDDPRRIGLIAQDVLAADPTLAKFFVDEDENGMLGLKPADLVFPLIAAVQYLAKEVEKLKNEK